MQRRSEWQSGEAKEKSGLGPSSRLLWFIIRTDYRRRGPANTKPRGAGIDDEVLQPEELLQIRPRSGFFPVLDSGASLASAKCVLERRHGRALAKRQ